MITNTPTSAERLLDFYLPQAKSYASIFLVRFEQGGFPFYGINIVSEPIDVDETINEGFIAMHCGHDVTEDYDEIKHFSEFFISKLKENGAVSSNYKLSSISKIEQTWQQIFANPQIKNKLIRPH